MSKETESNFLFFIRLVISNWKFLISTYLIVGITTIVILLSLPEWYKSKTTLVILEENASPLNGALSQFSTLGLGFGLGGGINVDTYIQYVYTRKMYDRLIDQFDLQTVYQTKTRDETYENIYNNLSVVDNENQTFSISFAFEENPEVAKNILQFIILQLEEIALEVDQAQSSNYRNYIEKYYLSTKERLKSDEDSLVKYQHRSGILDLSTQVQATIEGIAELEMKKVSLEISRNLSQLTMTDYDGASDIDSKIQAIDIQLSNMDKNDYSTLLSLSNLPENGTDYLRLVRDIKVGSQVSEFLRLQYEQALLDENKITSNFYVLDPPSYPEKRFKPARTKLLFIIMVFTFFLSLIAVRLWSVFKTNEVYIKELLDQNNKIA